jgi:acetyltransferase-like isoleucine patch superfamily enzyme
MGAAITADSPEAAQFAGLGEGSYLAFPQGVLENPGRIRIGAGCVVNEQVTLSADLPGGTGTGDPRIVLGDRCVLGRGTEILALGRVELGEDVWTASRVLIVDHHHRHDQPDVAVGLQIPLRKSTVTIGRGSVISTGATILAGAWIGAYCMVAAGAVVRPGHYPNNSLIAGNPAAIKPFGSLPVAPDREQTPLDIPNMLPREHPDPNVQTRIKRYLEAHSLAARTPSPETYREVADQAMQLQAALGRDDPGNGELSLALFDRAYEFGRQASLFPRP